MWDTKLPRIGLRRIVSMGMVCTDQRSMVASYPAPGLKIRTTVFDQYFSRNMAKAAVAAIQLVAETSMIISVRKGTPGKTAIEALSTAKVDVSILQCVHKARTPLTYIFPIPPRASAHVPTQLPFV